MTINYTEKRNYIRMSINHKLTYKLDGSEVLDTGMCKNLSANGVLFSSENTINPGTVIDINITPSQSVTLPLDAMVEVIRSTMNKSGDSYDIAGVIRQMN